VLEVLPALNAPTISQLSDPEWVAVNTIMDEAVARDVIPSLKAARATGIVEYPLNKVVL
jgi:ATP phosphoribosyltransferase